VIAVLLAYVVPQVVSVYEQSRQTLPWLTQALIALSGFFRATGWYWLAGLVAALVAVALANRREAFRARWEPALVRMPGAGRLARGGACPAPAASSRRSTRRVSRARLRS